GDEERRRQRSVGKVVYLVDGGESHRRWIALRHVAETARDGIADELDATGRTRRWLQDLAVCGDFKTQKTRLPDIPLGTAANLDGVDLVVQPRGDGIMNRATARDKGLGDLVVDVDGIGVDVGLVRTRLVLHQ